MINRESRRKELRDMVTVQEAARRLGVSRARVQQFIDNGRLPATKITPRMYLLDARDIRQFAAIPRKAGRRPKKSC